MVTKTERVASKILWSLTVLVSFLLIFESKIVLPVWLQSFGRMHPLLLHFPIVLIVIGAVFELFGLSRNGEQLHRPVRLIWLTGALTAGFTVLMGLFLSLEDGYTGDTLSWHKWTGAAVFYLAACCYGAESYPAIRKQKRFIAGIAAVLIVASGHFGAEMTHGEGFISEPLRQDQAKENVPFEEALVFDDVVFPILESKCTSCHNQEKAKGELILTDSAFITKGGKSGGLIKAFQPSLSLLLERIHLPLEEKKHMPPKGKPQITPEEEAVLIAWIKAGTPFSAKITSISGQDSLSILAKNRLRTADKETPAIYDFKPADPEVIAQLNNEYRNVSPVAFNSPALSVNLYGSQLYSARHLEELSPVKSQIVALNVSRMPVTDQDLKIISSFENLRQVNLNFTGITTKGLAQLQNLSYLETLYLAGTSLDESEFLKWIPEMKSLKNVTLWETDLKGDKLSSIRKQHPSIQFLSDFNPNDTTRLKLNKPLARSDGWVFDKNTILELYHPVKEVRLTYTLDGSEPDSLSPVSGGPIQIDRSATVRVKGYKEGWHPSDVADYHVFRNTFKPDSVFLLNRLNRVHLAEGAHTFFDKQLGSIGANNPAWANHFAGVRDEDLQLLCWFNTPVDLRSVGIRIMVEEATGIYPPAIIEVWGGENENQLRLISRNVSPELPEPGEKPSLRKIELPVTGQKPLSCLKIVAKPFHKPKERPKLILIDEMFLN